MLKENPKESDQPDMFRPRSVPLRGNILNV